MNPESPCFIFVVIDQLFKRQAGRMTMLPERPEVLEPWRNCWGSAISVGRFSAMHANLFPVVRDINA
jgi:hypothetical protein